MPLYSKLFVAYVYSIRLWFSVFVLGGFTLHSNDLVRDLYFVLQRISRGLLQFKKVSIQYRVGFCALIYGYSEKLVHALIVSICQNVLLKMGVVMNSLEII